MNFDLALALRRIKPQRPSVTPRRTQALPRVTAPATGGPALLLDTCVYIDVLQGRAPAPLTELLRARIINHSTVCLAELTHLFGRLDPAHPGTKQALREVSRTIEDLPDHRMASPSTAALGQAGMLAGLVARITNARREAGPALLNDAMLYLQALEAGQVLITRNTRDFEFFDRLLPAGRLLVYERQ